MNENTIFIYENIIGKLLFQYDSRMWVTDIDGISSVEISIADTRNPMQIGSTITGQSVRSRSFTIDGAIFEPLATARERILKIIAPQIPSTLTIKHGSEAWYLDVVPEKTPEFTPGNGVQFFQTRLRAAYPYWRTTTSYSKQISGLAGMLKFPFNINGSWWISKYSGSYFSTIENRGNMPIEFQVTFTARSTLENPELLHVDTGEHILIRKSMLAGEKIKVSTIYGQKGVVCINASGERHNGFKYLSIDSNLSMTLNPGSNLLRVDAVNREGLDVRIEAPEGVRSGV